MVHTFTAGLSPEEKKSLSLRESTFYKKNRGHSLFPRGITLSVIQISFRELLYKILLSKCSFKEKSISPNIDNLLGV